MRNIHAAALTASLFLVTYVGLFSGQVSAKACGEGDVGAIDTSCKGLAREIKSVRSKNDPSDYCYIQALKKLQHDNRCGSK